MAYAFRSIWNPVLTALVLLASFSGAVWGQGGTGELTGIVTDPSGAVITGGEVTLSNRATGEEFRVTTTSAGTYRFGALQVVGAYVLEIEAQGFKTYRIENVIISVGAVTTHDARLEIGVRTENVTVEAGVQQVQTTESSLSGLVDRHVWQDMPLETRSQNEFIGLLAGAEPASIAQLGADRGAAVNGARSGSGNFLVEGFDNNDQSLGGAGRSVGPGGANTTIDPDAIQEYRVIEHIPAAEYGKAGGFVTDTVLKSGTNQWHGSLFEYNRVQALAANSWFSNNAGQQDHLVRNQFGGSVGGPVVKDKTFFFFTAEAHRERENSPLTVPTITPDLVNFVQSGAFEQFMEGTGAYTSIADTGLCRTFTATSQNPNGTPCPGAFAQDATTGPVWQKIYAAEPLPLCTPGTSNCTNLTMGAQSLYTGGILGFPVLTYPVNIYGTLTVPQPFSLNQMRYTGKFDHKLGEKDQLNAAYLYDNADSVKAYGGNNTMGPTLYEHVRAQNLGVTWSHIFSSTILNQARAAYVRHTGNLPGDPSVLGMPDITTYWDSPYFGFGNAYNFPQLFTENEFQYKDDLSVTWGKHNFKGGAEYRRTRNGSSFDSYKYGLLEPQGSEDLLTDETFSEIADNLVYGLPTYGSLANAEASLNPATGQLPVYYRGYRANEFAFYIQDDWRIHPRLTLNLGVRWEYFGPPHNFRPGLDSNFYTGTPVTPIATASTNPFFPVNSAYYAGFAAGTVQHRNHDIWNKDFHNFGPRLGFAWDTWGNERMVVRGGFGINYDRMYNNVFENIRFNPPAFALGLLGPFNGNGSVITPAQTAALNAYPFTGTSTFAGAGLTPSIRAMDQNIVTPYYEQANLGFEYQLGNDFVLESNYVGTFGHKLIGIIGANLFDGEYAANLDNTPINPNYSSINLRTNCCNSNYSAWQTTLRKRFTNGLQFNVNYTFSKAMDEISDAFYTKNNSNDYPTDSMNPHFDYGPADFDVKHRAVASFIYELPFAKRNRWLGGWNVSGIVSLQTGTPFSVTNSSVDSNGDGQFNDRAVYIGPGNLSSDIHHNVSPAAGYLTGDNQDDGSNPAWGMLNGPHSTDPACPTSVNMGLWCEGKSLGQMERNALTGPGYFNTDFGFGKSFNVTENSKLTLHGNFFNLFNHPNFLLPDADLNDVGTFGKSLGTFAPGPGGARVTQLALRFDF